jgi:hypothetical protein
VGININAGQDMQHDLTNDDLGLEGTVREDLDYET